MNRPIIGITSAYEMEEGLKNYFRTTVSIDYSKSVIMAGGIPVVIPANSDTEVIKKQLSLIDGLILSGGVDINPFLYGEDFKQGIGVISPERDEFELIVLEEFLKTGKPILAICRGHQLVNIFFGGSLHQDLRYAGENILKHRQDFHPELATQKLKIIDEENMLYDLYGESVGINSFHHQVINKMGVGLTVIAKTEDGIIEAFQKKDYNFLYGIQWHPEMMTARGNEEMKKLFVKFIESCKEKS